MANKRLNKRFVMSDSSVNVYGMRLLTSGYDMAEFLKNPIGYYGHKKEDGVLLKWEDVRIEGDAVMGTPVVNMEHPRAERTVKEVEEGFLNAASVGKLVIVDAELEENPNDPANPILRVTKWYNKECSLVDNPGNRNAMKVELYDGNDNELNLHDIIHSKTKKANMKKVTLELTPKLLGQLNLGDEGATAEAVTAGIEAMHRENETLAAAKKKAEEDLADSKAKAVKERVTEILRKGLEEKRFTVETRNKLEKAYAQMPDELADLVGSMPAYEAVAQKIVLTQGGGVPKDLADKTWEELDLADKLETLKKADFELFKKKYLEQCGAEYSGQ